MDERNLLLNGEILLNRWRVLEKIGEGTFSQIYTAFDLTNPSHKVAVKVEAPSQMKPVLEWESQVLLSMQKKSTFVCKYHHHGKHGDNFILIMELLGDNMSKMRSQPDATHGVPLTKCISAAVQMLDSLESLHAAGYIHRDIKASNFALSNGKEVNKKYYIIDFGLSKQHLDPEGNPLVARDKAEFRGTSMYASLQAHRREELGRRDDLWSWLYLVLDFIRGELPWAHDAQKKNREVVVELKEYFLENPEQMVEGLPGARHLLAINEYLKTMSYGDIPNYTLIRKHIKAVEDINDEESLLQEWDGISDTRERADKWKKSMESGLLTDDTLLKVAKHYSSFFSIEDASIQEMLDIQELIWIVERRATKRSLDLPPTIQSFGERRLTENKRKLEALQKRREKDFHIRQGLPSAKRLKASSDEQVNSVPTQLDDMKVSREEGSHASSQMLDTPPKAVVDVLPTEETKMNPTTLELAPTLETSTTEDKPRRVPKRSRWDA